MGIIVSLYNSAALINALHVILAKSRAKHYNYICEFVKLGYTRLAVSFPGTVYYDKQLP